MEWRKRGLEWVSLQAQLKEPARALVVDDEEVMRDLFAAILKDGFVVESVGDAEAALARLRTGVFDVLITDKNLPGHDGVDLIAQVRAERIATSSILVTGYPSLETISRALSHGAVDYIAKPFDDVRHVRRRIEHVVEQRRTERLLARIAADLKDAIEAGGPDAEALKPVQRSLMGFREALAARPDVIVLESRAQVARLEEMFLKTSGLTVSLAEDLAGLRAKVDSLPPMAVLLSLDVPGAAALIPQLRAADPDLELLAAGRAAALEEALAAVTAGASDYVIGAVEGIDLLVARVRRAVGRSRRRRLFAYLVSQLLKAAGGEGEVRKVLESLQPATPEPEVVEEVIEFEEEVDLSEVLEPLLEDDWGVAVGPMNGAQAAVGLDVPYTGVEEQVGWGLGGVDPARKVEVPLKDLLYVAATLKELIRFLHEPANCPTVESLRNYVGDADQGALKVLGHAFFEALRPNLPEDVRRDLEAGRYDHPRPPYYLKPGDS
jgi:DNA-binding response OmpR family regulator